MSDTVVASVEQTIVTEEVKSAFEKKEIVEEPQQQTTKLDTENPDSANPQEANKAPIDSTPDTTQPQESDKGEKRKLEESPVEEVQEIKKPKTEEEINAGGE